MECVSEFVYIGSQITYDGKLDTEVEKHTAAASRAFGALPCSFSKQNTVCCNQETCVSGVCVKCAIVWRGVLDTVQVTPGSPEPFSPEPFSPFQDHCSEAG